MNKDISLLVLRVGISLSMLVLHGWGKLIGGPERWERVGVNMKHLGITFAPVFWGFCASVAESVGSVLIILGALFRPAAALLAITMAVAGYKHMAEGDGIMRASHAFELMLVYIALYLAGPGKYAFELRKSHG